MMGQIGLTSSKISSESKDFLMNRTDVAPFNPYGYMLKENTTIDGFSSQSIYAIAVIDDIAYAISSDNTGFRGGSASSDLCIKNNAACKIKFSNANWTYGFTCYLFPCNDFDCNYAGSC